MKKHYKVLAAVVLAAAAGVWFVSGRKKGGEQFRIAEVTRGDLRAVISASGTVEPEEVIDVGAQVAGLIKSFGQDRDGKTVDYGSVVDEGTVLAQIDDSLYTAEADQAKAQLEQAKANVGRSQGELEQAHVKLDQSARDWSRTQQAGPNAGLSQSTIDSYRSSYESAKSGVPIAESNLEAAKAAVDLAAAALSKAQRNLAYCTITSPVKGTIIDRRVNIGQTVVSSLNAPSLFLIAKDLRRMQVWVSVNEADIGNIHPGQTVSFSVDAFSGQKFSGQVNKVRLNAAMTQNVVTYTVEVVFDNSDGRLLPYLTANVDFELARRQNVLLVPNGALRWTPSSDLIAPAARKRAETGAGGTTNDTQRGTLWLQEGAFVKPVYVKTGYSDGVMTEILDTDLKEGAAIVIGRESSAAPDSKNVTNPFGPPQIRRH